MILSKKNRKAFHALLALSCVLFYTLSTIAQVIVYPKKINFGVVTVETDRIVDIIVQNPKDKSDFLLRIENSHELDVIYSSKTMEPDGQITIRMKLNPRNTGPFQEDLKLHFGSLPVPIIIPITADIQDLDPLDHIPCPSFSEREADCCSSNMFLVEVVDAVTGLPINETRISLSQEGKEYKKFLTREDGKASQSIHLGYYTVQASVKGYISQEIHSYVNSQHRKFRFELERDPNVVIEEVPIPEVILEDTTSAIVLSTELPENIFKPNNIVFLVDVSTSMSTGDKMELAQMTMNQLSLALRAVDQVSIISYAGDAEILLENSSGSNHSEMFEIIKEFKAYGTTAGANGFKNAFKVLKTHEIIGGNNQLIVITDGAFKTSDQGEIEKLVLKQAKRNYKTSIVGIKGSEYAKENLERVTLMGSGSYVSVDNVNDAESALLEEIKKQSRK